MTTRKDQDHAWVWGVEEFHTSQADIEDAMATACCDALDNMGGGGHVTHDGVEYVAEITVKLVPSELGDGG